MKLLICVASTPPIGQALPMGKLIATHTQANVTLLHVYQNNNQQSQGEQILAAASAQLSDMPHQTRLEQGKSADVILAVAEETSPHLIVIGARRAEGSDQPAVGKVARQVMSQASISTLVAKATPHALQRLLVCSGGRPIADPVINLGADLAEAAHAKLTLLHVSSAVPSMYTGLNTMEESIEDLMRSDTPEAQHLRASAQMFEQRGIEAVLELRHGVAADEIIRSSQFRDYDLLLLGSPDATPRLRRLFFGQVTQNVVERAPISVLVVRPGQ